MVDVASSDGHANARIHTALASVVVWTDLTGTITVRRGGADVVTLAAGRCLWYDHYPPHGVATAYTVTNGTTTSTPATITVPANTARRAWLKSVDPYRSLAVPIGTLGAVSYKKRRGVFEVLGRSDPFVVESSTSTRTRGFEFLATTSADRDKVLALLATGPFLTQVHPTAEEPDMWASSGDVSVKRIGTVAGNVAWVISTELTEITKPSGIDTGGTVPGWTWNDVAATYATWNAVKAAHSTWLSLALAGIS